MGLDVKVLDKYENEIDLKQSFDDDDDIGLGSPGIPDDLPFENDTVADDLTGFGLEDENGDAVTDDEEEDFIPDEDEFDEEM